MEPAPSGFNLFAVGDGLSRPGCMVTARYSGYALRYAPGCEQQAQLATSRDAWASSKRSLRPAPPPAWGANALRRLFREHPGFILNIHVLAAGVEYGFQIGLGVAVEHRFVEGDGGEGVRLCSRYAGRKTK